MPTVKENAQTLIDKTAAAFLKWSQSSDNQGRGKGDLLAIAHTYAVNFDVGKLLVYAKDYHSKIDLEKIKRFSNLSDEELVNEAQTHREKVGFAALKEMVSHAMKDDMPVTAALMTADWCADELRYLMRILAAFREIGAELV